MTDIIYNRLFQISSNNNTLVKSTPDELIKQLTPYMLLVSTKQSNKCDDENTENKIDNTDMNVPDTIIPHINNTISPLQRDSLFWCIYIAINDYAEYNMIHNHNTCEIEWKQKLSKKITEQPTKMKMSNHRITKANVSEILSDLMTNPYTTDVLCLIAITIYCNINIIIMNESKTIRFEFMTANEGEKTYVLYKNDRNYYSICPEPLMEFELDDIRKTSFLIENNEKQMKSVGSYKVDALVQYAKMFDLYNEVEKYKKTDIYNMVREYVTRFTL